MLGYTSSRCVKIQRTLSRRLDLNDDGAVDRGSIIDGKVMEITAIQLAGG
jgi:hypothetical protein